MLLVCLWPELKMIVAQKCALQWIAGKSIFVESTRLKTHSHENELFVSQNLAMSLKCVAAVVCHKAGNISSKESISRDFHCKRSLTAVSWMSRCVRTVKIFASKIWPTKSKRLKWDLVISNYCDHNQCQNIRGKSSSEWTGRRVPANWMGETEQNWEKNVKQQQYRVEWKWKFLAIRQFDIQKYQIAFSPNSAVTIINTNNNHFRFKIIIIIIAFIIWWFINMWTFH